MRKFFRVSTLAALALGVTAMSAQAQQKSVSLLAGVNFATLTGDNSFDGTGTRTAFVGGIGVGIPVGGGGVSIEPEVLYSMQGAPFDGAGFKGDFDADYIKIPVLVKWSANPGGKGVYLMAGPSVGFNVGCNVSGTGPGFTYDGSCEDVEGFKPKTTFSGDIGLGYTTGRIGLEGRYTFDWGNAFELAATGESLNLRNAVWQIMVRLTK